MKNLMVTIFLSTFFLPLGAAVAESEAEHGHTHSLCSGEPIRAARNWSLKYTPPSSDGAALYFGPLTKSVADYCESACDAHLVGCKNVAKEATKCELDVIQNVERQAKKECRSVTDKQACEKSLVAYVQAEKDHIADEKIEATEYCYDAAPSCIRKCTDKVDALLGGS